MQGWANLNQQQSPWGNGNNQYYPNNNNMNQGFNSGFNNNYNNQGFNQGFNNQGFNNMAGGFNNYQNPQPPIPFNNNQNVSQVIANGQKFVGQSKKIMQKMKNQHLKSVEKIQHLETIKISLDSEQNYLRVENSRMSEFLRKNEKEDFKDLTALIRPKDQRSQQILDISASIKARQDCLTLLEDRFGANEISFEEFIKLVKKLEE